MQPTVGSLDRITTKREGDVMTMAWINISIMIFFGIALVIGVYFGWVLLRNEMIGRPKPPPDTYDFGFGPPQPDQKTHP
jgi:hypothetical protein